MILLYSNDVEVILHRHQFIQFYISIITISVLDVKRYWKRMKELKEI